MKKLLILVTTAFFAVVFIFSCGFCMGRVACGVKIGGLSVGGLPYGRAERLVRQNELQKLQKKCLRICVDEQTFDYTYPTLNMMDDLFTQVRKAQKGGAYAPNIAYVLLGQERIAQDICATCCRQTQEPRAVIVQGGFDYEDGCEGRYLDIALLHQAIDKSLQTGLEEIRLQTQRSPFHKTMAQVKEQTVLLARFSTAYDASNGARSQNIALACSKIDGTILGSSGEFSFNAVVGKRTKERGFARAKVIQEGQFVDGVGGGVCQVSTTLYNAALLAGLTVTEQHPHSLAVGYVAPSRDAMVSGTFCDLKFINKGATPVYLRAHASGGKLTCSVYGKSDGWNYSFESVVTGTVPPAEGEQVLKEGITSQGFLVKERAGVVVKKWMRTDKYAPVRIKNIQSVG